MGQAAALDAEGGEIRWRLDLMNTFGGRNIRWGIAESPLIVDGKVIFTPGGPDATLVALDKKTGNKVWGTSGVGDKSAYCTSATATC